MKTEGREKAERDPELGWERSLGCLSVSNQGKEETGGDAGKFAGLW